MAKNISYIDGQNLHLATTRHPENPWQVDLARFRVYLREKYHVHEAYYYLGYPNGIYNALYEELQRVGFIIRFRDHQPAMISEKKGNVDTEIIFDAMKVLYRKEDFEKIVLVSGDGDYYKLINFLIEENRLVKLLFPNRKRASSLYYSIDRQYYDDLSRSDMRAKIGKRKEGVG